MADIWYVDPTVATTSGSGSFSDPLKTITAGLGKLTRAADQILRIRGGFYYDETLPGTQFSNVIIEPYGESGNPCIDGLTYLPVGTVWTDEGAADAGGRIFSIQLGTAQDVKRVFAATTKSGILLSQRVLGEALRRAPDQNLGGMTATTDTLASIKAALNVNDQWYGAGAALTYKLYMWTPSQFQDPSTYYQGLGITQSGAGTPNGFGSGFNLYNTRNAQIRNIQVRGATGWSYQIAVDDTVTFPNEDIVFYQCESVGALEHFRVSQNAKSQLYPTVIRRVTFRECYADTYSSAKEQEPNIGYAKLSAKDQYYIGGRVEDVQIVDCVGINPTHAATSIGAWDAAGAMPRRSGYLRHRAYASSWASYARGLNVALTEESCYVTGCLFQGMNVMSQLAGSIKVTASRWTGMRQAIRKPGNSTESTDGWIAMTGYRNDQGNGSVGADRYVDMRPNRLVFANNSCDGCYGYPLQFTLFTYPGTEAIKAVPSMTDSSFFFWNNVLLDTQPSRTGKVYLNTYTEGTLSLGVQSLRNNAIFGGAGVTPSAKWGATTYADMNLAPGHSDNINVNPMVDADMRPRAGSPLISAGRHIGYFRDYAGRPFKLLTSIGPFEDFTMQPRQQRAA